MYIARRLSDLLSSVKFGSKIRESGRIVRLGPIDRHREAACRSRA